MLKCWLQFMKCSEVCQEGTMLWKCKTWLSVWWPLSGGSNTPPVTDINLLGANWKREMYLFMYLLLSGCCDAEWGATASWVSARLCWAAFCQLDDSSTNTCVSAKACIHVSCTIERGETSRVQMLLQNEDPNPRDFVRVTKDLPWAQPRMPTLEDEHGFSYLEPVAESWEDCWFICFFFFYERVHSL